MIINPITDGIVLDHIQAGKGMELYHILGLDELECAVAIIKNANSVKMGKKDIIKIDQVIDLNLDVLGYIDQGITVNIIQNGKRIKHGHLELPEQVEGVITCKNPRCITTTETTLPQVFRLTDREQGVYRCIYCEARAK
ncbi:MAG: aspartate carbamoyltransferase regulatory subunit [Ruminococcaceae bacterium]|nr:aspartate carbamoyltransferase regulatory subunit [Oscillospiraceae bacterium]